MKLDLSIIYNISNKMKALAFDRICLMSLKNTKLNSNKLLIYSYNALVERFGDFREAKELRQRLDSQSNYLLLGTYNKYRLRRQMLIYKIEADGLYYIGAFTPDTVVDIYLPLINPLYNAERISYIHSVNPTEAIEVLLMRDDTMSIRFSGFYDFKGYTVTKDGFEIKVKTQDCESNDMIQLEETKDIALISLLAMLSIKAIPSKYEYSAQAEQLKLLEHRSLN